MPTQTPEQEWTFEDLYNLLMERIEPEICTYNIDELQEIYAGETEKERDERLQHYARCIELFWDALKELISITRTDLKEFEKAFMEQLKVRIAGTEQSELSDIEDSISNS